MFSVLVTNTKGGCGKTTISTHIAAAFANGGFNTMLADVDRQQSSLNWLELRSGEVAPISGADWHKSVGKIKKNVERLVIDAPAGVRVRHVDELLENADLLVVPVLPSIFDEQSTEDFLNKIHKIKPLRKGKKPILVVANRLKHRTKAAARLLDKLKEWGFEPAATIYDRAVLGECAQAGQTIFDMPRHKVAQARLDWLPLIDAIEEQA